MSSGKFPSLLSINNGKPEIATVDGKSKCAKCKAAILSGSQCFQMKHASGGFNNARRYCLKCGLAILNTTHDGLNKVLHKVRSLLGEGPEVQQD